MKSDWTWQDCESVEFCWSFLGHFDGEHTARAIYKSALYRMSWAKLRHAVKTYKSLYACLCKQQPACPCKWRLKYQWILGEEVKEK